MKCIGGKKFFEAGISILLTTTISLTILIGLSLTTGMVSGGNPPLVPHPIYGTAVYACGEGNADGATVEVVTNNSDVPPEDRKLTTVVGPDGGWGSGEWQVDCGDPGPNWPEGSYFVVYINGTGDYEGWQGTAEGVVSGYYNDMGEITVYPPELVADANGPYSGVAGESIQFTGSASGGVEPYSWSWDFGDGNTSDEQNPTHTYSTSGNYTVTLTVTDSCSLTTDTDTTWAQVNPALEADANGPYSGTICDAIQFTGSATGGIPPYTYHWDFGDGNTSDEQNPTHQYTTPGNYTVVLTVTDDVGHTDDDVTYASVVHPDVEADANGPYSGEPGTPIQFTGSASGGCPPYSWSWDFGDGGSSNEQNPTHTYSTQGNYTVTLTVTDDMGYTGVDTTWVEITVELRANADGPYSAKVGEDISFTGSATGGVPPYSWSWDFGDGGSSNEQNPVHAYDTEGVYTVTLTVTDSNGDSDSDTTTATITSETPPLVVDADGPYNGHVDELIHFIGTVTGGTPPYVYTWKFGDGNMSSERSPWYAYSKPGVYTATFIVSDSEGKTAQDTADVNIIGEEDTTPPTLSITKPLKNSIYIGNSRILPFMGTWIFGEIEIKASASDASGVDRVEFYVDNVLKATDTTEPYSWTWSEKTFGRHAIKVVAYDTVGNHASREMKVWKFF